jgi:hypothetical protein
LNELLLGHTQYVLSCNAVSATSVVELVERLLAGDRQIREALNSSVPKIRLLSQDAGKYLYEALQVAS